MLRLILLVIVLVLVGLSIAITFLPWWGSVILVIVLIVIGKFVGGWFVKRFFMIPFRMKGAALRGAEIEVHAITPAEAPPKAEVVAGEKDDEEEEAEPADTTPRRYYSLDVTITPKPSGGPFQFWEPTELVLVPPTAAKDIESEDDSCAIAKFEAEENGEFQSQNLDKYNGPRRLRLLLGVKDGVRELKFRYYFEVFGTVVVP